MKGKIIRTALIGLLAAFLMPATVRAASIYGNPHISFSPDGQAWTTDAKETEYEGLNRGYEVITGETGTLRALEAGEHYYPVDKTDLLLVEKWQVHMAPGRCIHGTQRTESNWHGLSYIQYSCYGAYKNGWIATCADCHEEIPMLFYMDQDTARSLKKLPIGIAYYYLCPLCTCLEQGASVTHECKAISWNRYQVKYDKNSLGAEGIMYDSTFMYNNATTYEGKEITAETRLRKNSFERNGYEFVGWNTEPDGSGRAFADEEEILNLTSESNGNVILYAQWTKSESTLHINPGGGAFDSQTGMVSVKQRANTTLDVSSGRLTPPAGAFITFEEKGGSAVEDMQTQRHFKGWSKSYPFHGTLEDTTYHYTGKNGSEDTITAIYGYTPVTLPATEKDGWAFGGWYRDEACTLLVGTAGDEVIITHNTTLYAGWVSLQLTAVDDYTVYGGGGAVDLTWKSVDTAPRAYQVYQKREGGTWNKIKQVGAESVTVQKHFDATGAAKTYVIPYTGLYTLTATGAQGQSYTDSEPGSTTKAGGKGGSIVARAFLQKGEVLTYNVGTTSGYNGGGTGTPYGNGGGMTSISSNKKGTLLIAGGGGGASVLMEGGPGGAETSLTSNSYGGSGGAGGGGGYRGGTPGEAIIHHHTPECYVNGTETADSGFYANVDRAHTGTFGIQAYDSVDYTGIRAQAYKWPATLRLTTSKANAFSTPGTGTLHFTVATEEPNVWGISGTSLRDEDADYQIYVHDAATDACLYYLDLDSLAYSVSSHEERICSSAGCTDHTRIRTTYSFDNGIVSGYRTKAPHTGYINHSGNWDGADSYEYFTLDFHLPIAETTNGIYVNMVSTFRYAEDVIGVNLKLKNMSYSYAYQTCNREEGEIIAATKAYGGSNYVNSTYCTLVSTKAGVGSGNGSVDIHLSAVECIDNMELHNVAAKDMAAPDRIQQDTISKRVYDGRSIKVEWKRPKDRGTVYCHQVSGHEVSHGDEVCRSNITENIMESGIKGYYFLEDEYPDTQVTLKNGRFSGESSCLLMLQAEKRYLHVAAMDVAGNLSESVHVPIWEQDEAVPWPIATQPITLWSEEDNIYPAAEREWYVRGDGETAFTLYLVAGMPRGASKGYQINYLDFLVDNGVAGGTFSICVPNCEIEDGEYEYDRDQLTKSILGASFLEDAVYTRVVRSNRGNCLEAMQKFVIDAGYDGQRLHVIPSAGAQWQEQVVRSDTALDVPNGLWLRVDGEAPEIGGVDALSGWSSKEGEYVACFTAEDGGSGMREFYCTIVNKDQYVQREIRSTDGQYLELRLAETDPLLAGDVEIRFLAVDNVGNRRYMVVENPFFSMTATVERILSPHEPLFKAGESGRILVDTYGFARRLEVRYPSDWAEWGFPKGENFDYGQSTVYHRQEQLQFMVPLKAREGSYEFEVKAYKEGGGYLEQTLQIQVKGSILDELHTRLR